MRAVGAAAAGARAGVAVMAIGAVNDAGRGLRENEAGDA